MGTIHTGLIVSVELTYAQSSSQLNPVEAGS